MLWSKLPIVSTPTARDLVCSSMKISEPINTLFFFYTPQYRGKVPRSGEEMTKTYQLYNNCVHKLKWQNNCDRYFVIARRLHCSIYDNVQKKLAWHKWLVIDCTDGRMLLHVDCSSLQVRT